MSYVNSLTRFMTPLNNLVFVKKYIIFIIIILAGRVIPESKDNSALFPLNTSRNISERNIAMLTEQFKPIECYEGLYEISNFGRVKSLAKEWYGGFGKRKKGETILSPAINSSGYLCVVLCNKSINKSVQIHQLVWDAFGDSKRNGGKLQIDHIDENKINNNIENLRLVTQRENVSKNRLLIKNSNFPTGVSQHIKTKQYYTRIMINNKIHSLGYYNTPEEAGEAYQKKLLEIDK